MSDITKREAMDKLVINNIKISTRIGCLPWEQQCTQNIRLDISLQTDAKSIAVHDDIAQAINYDEVVKHLQHFVSHSHFALIETLAQRCADEVLEHFPTHWVKIVLHKPGALLAASDVSITIEREK